jgi:hypothetical protein
MALSPAGEHTSFVSFEHNIPSHDVEPESQCNVSSQKYKEITKIEDDKDEFVLRSCMKMALSCAQITY